ncbi:MAG: glycosyltransferase family 4 protein [Candidatus Marinimicrobia bacterium]|nr:glycosyltransferase family 4 protein [Candidatus Neomarinimicrobiota bacterium]MCF7829836.1 glycosyltransferase family 4 protein [Candidatus Neomarinimicrobiota bacterium]MCF7881731.1 glycosyltransferase family 4 protein [Candidatus Neomarinimicrobiota bacterium]MCF8232838.1 glycosyltransferase family 4 protein [Bacteroidales bacterium]
MVVDKIFPTDERVEYEARSLAQDGHQVSIFSYSHPGKDTQEDLGYAKVVRLPVNRFFAKKFKQITPILPVFSMLWRKPLSRILKSQSIDIFHAHDLYMVPVCLFLREKMGARIPIIADLHENYPAALDVYDFANTFPGSIVIDKSSWKKKELEWLRKTKKIIVVIEESKQYYIQRGIPSHKIHIVPNYVNLQRFHLPQEKLQTSRTDNLSTRETTNFLYIGAINYHRGLQEIINALAQPKLKGLKLKLWIVGDGSYLDHLQFLTNELHLENVYFFGRKPHTELPKYIQDSDICLIPHIKSLHTDTTIPHKLTQYMAFKKPVLASNCTPIKRIIQQVKSGYTYKSGDIEHLVNQILLLISKRQEWPVMGKRAYDAVQNSFNWGVSSTNLTEMYKTISHNYE